MAKQKYPQHNYYKYQFKDLAEFLKLQTQSMKNQITRAVKRYLERFGPSYRELHLMYPDMRMDMFAKAQKKKLFDRGLLVECVFCYKGTYRNSYCHICLGSGLMDKIQLRQFKCTKEVKKK